MRKGCLKVPPRVSQGTPKGTKNAQKSSVGVPWEGLGRHLRNSCKKRAPLEGRTCNPLMPVQSKHSFQCSDFSYFWHQIYPTFDSNCPPFRSQCLKKAVPKITQKSTPKKCRKVSKKGCQSDLKNHTFGSLFGALRPSGCQGYPRGPPKLQKIPKIVKNEPKVTKKGWRKAVERIAA